MENQKLSEEKLSEITKELNRLKKLSKRFDRDQQIKALERLLESK
jgi:hypothetical protein